MTTVDDDKLWAWLKVNVYSDRFSAEMAAPEWPVGDEIAGQVESILCGAHIVRWNPARALREVAAKEQTLARHKPRIAVEGRNPGYVICGCSNGADEFYAVAWPCRDVIDLASVYADDEDYAEMEALWARG